jgi:hypothetical protein
LARSSPWTINVVDKVIVLSVILCWIVLTVLCERYYVRGAEEGTLLRRAALVIVPSLVVVGAGYALGLATL